MNKINYSITNTDIDKYLGNGHIIKYCDLEKYDDISDVFGDDAYVVILVQSKANNGHWVCLLQYDDGTVEQFDSYSGKIDSELKYISEAQQELLGEDEPLLTQLITRSRCKTVWSKYRFQKLNDNIDTCGKHCLLRIIMFVLGHKTIDQYTTWFKNLAKSQGCSNDELVCRLITF